MPSKLILVTGGVRSGKSLFAEQYVKTAGSKIAYIATAQTHDAEMEERVRMHKARRPAGWVTYEAPYNAHLAVAAATAQQCDAILFDCLTLYTSNLLLTSSAPADREERYQYVINDINQLLENACASSSTVVFVTNEVGMGIVPENALAREYRDIAGIVNQRVAACSQHVYLVVSGIAVDVKALAMRLPASDGQP